MRGEAIQPARGRTGPKAAALRVETPAFVIDERAIDRAVEAAARLRDRAGCKVLYALKPLGCPFVLARMAPVLDGFATSSLFESRLAREAIAPSGTVHLTMPGLRASEMPELAALCDAITFNSLPQFRRLGPVVGDPSRVGLRVNPGLSLVDDPRYDPCRPASKLGVPIASLRSALRRDPGLVDGFRGLHFHTNCDSADFAPLLRTVELVEARLGPWLSRMDWINLGGGYLLDPGADSAPLVEAVGRLRDRYDVAVYLEPGAAFVRGAGSLVAEVIDLFRSGDRVVAMLDTTVNHMPEVFEYQFEPDMEGHDDDGEHEYLLAGCSCLAGDVLGDYAVDRPLRVGSRVVLPNLGAYAMVKAQMFNGINLPTLYSLTPDGELVLRRRYTYRDFLSRTGAPGDDAV